MIRFLIPLLLVAGVAFVQWQVSVRRTRAMLSEKSRPLEDPVLGKYLARLADAAGVPAVDVRVFDEPMINGLATPDGEIFITSGLFQKYLKRQIGAAEIASVVAHELGHVALGHTKRRMIDVTGARMAHIVLGSILARFIPFIGWWIAAWVASLFVATLSRGDEFDADRYGAALMMKAGLGTEPQATMLEKLTTLIPGAKAEPPAWLASHPPVPERARRIRALGAGWESEHA